MAKYKKGQNAKYADTVADDDDDDGVEPILLSKLAAVSTEVDRQIHTSIFPLDEKPFSAINTNLLPVYYEDPKEYFDEFGFRKKDNNENENSNPFTEDSANKLKYISYLEFAHENVKDDLTWTKVEDFRLRSDKFDEMVKEIGIPHSMRPYLWPRLCGATQKRKSAGYTYQHVLSQSTQDKPSIGVQIERDLLRTLPNNLCFWKKGGPGVDALRRVLKSVAFIYPDLGYCQGMGVVVATLLLFCSEETTFWLMAAIIEDILPPNYYSQTLLGLQADERVTRHLMKSHVPDLNRVLDELEVEISLVTVNWLLTLFGTVLPTRTLLRVWDMLFTFGGVTMFRVIISMLKMKEDEIVEIADKTKSSADVFNAITQMPTKVHDVDKLIEYMTSFEFSITDHLVKELRKKHQAVLMADQGMIVNTAVETNLPKQKMQRRKITRSKSIIQQIFRSKSVDDDPKLKNVRQTEILVDLKESILQICRYFVACDDRGELTINMQADYSPESHLKDLENYLEGKRVGHKRARALLDFARQDEDELGFRKNDVITVISEKDEHCWIGEVNGLRGWFPAKFVEVVDERGKNYTVYGDEAVSPEITEYIRARLANSFRQVMEHGIRESIIYPSTSYHPWSFIEDVAVYTVEKHFNSVCSRLTLCNAFKLDQDGKILTPEELLFRTVQVINDSHNAVNAHQDVKLRSLLVVGVNEQVLHLWVELLCGSAEHETIRNKYYHNWAFIRTPAWKQIKCDLRLLSQFSFNLNVDLEVDGVEQRKKAVSNGMLPSTKKKILSTVIPVEKKSAGAEPLKSGVTDMLIKHHLFSWDL